MLLVKTAMLLGGCRFDGDYDHVGDDGGKFRDSGNNGCDIGDVPGVVGEGGVDVDDACSGIDGTGNVEKGGGEVGYNSIDGISECSSVSRGIDVGDDGAGEVVNDDGGSGDGGGCNTAGGIDGF